MSRVIIYGLMALSLGLSGCQATKMQSTPTTSANGVVNALPSRPGALMPMPAPNFPPIVAGPGAELPPDRPRGTDPRDPVLVGPPTDVTPLPLPMDPHPGLPTGTVVNLPTPTHPIRPGGNDPGQPRPVPPTPGTVTTVRPLVPTNPGPTTTIIPTRPVNPVTPITPGTTIIPTRPLNPVNPIGTGGGVIDGGPTGGTIGGVIPRGNQVSTLDTGRITDRTIRNAPLPPQRPSSFAVNETGTRVAPAAATSRPAAFKQIASVDGTCEERPVKVEKQNKKVSFVFMVDTSASLVKAGTGTKAQGELTQIAHGMPAFIRKLPAGLDYRIGVVLAHGPASPHFGKIFSAGANDPAVLNSKTMGEAQIIAALERKMMNVPDDTSAAQGEALNLGLYELTAHKQKIEAARDAGLFATGRDVIVIAVTDEQDVCFDYEGTGFKPVEKPYVINGKTVWQADPHETKFFNNVCRTFLSKNVTDYTAKDDRNHPVGYNDVIESFRSLEQKLKAKVIMQAIVYKTPQAPRSSHEDDKEMGHGIIELVEGMQSGTIADLANVDHSNNSIAFANELTQLGDSANFQMSFSSSFDCRTNEFHPDSIDKKTIELEILDNGRPVARYSSVFEAGRQNSDGPLSWRVEGKDGSKKGLRVYPKDQEAFARALRGSNIQNPMYKIRFKTLENVDHGTGKKNDGSAVKGPSSFGPIPSSKMTPAVSAPIGPVAPAAKPVVPAAKPVVPAAKPVVPAAKPVVPAAKPVTSKASEAKDAAETVTSAKVTLPAAKTATKTDDKKTKDKVSTKAPDKTSKATVIKPTKDGLPSSTGDAKK